MVKIRREGKNKGEKKTRMVDFFYHTTIKGKMVKNKKKCPIIIFILVLISCLNF